MRLLADSNWLIRLEEELRRKVEGPATRLRTKAIIHINTVAYAEFLSAGLTQERLAILARCARLDPLSYDDAGEAAGMRAHRKRKGKTLHLPDALMAATALRRSMRLLTSDKDFSGIPGLKWSNYPH